MFCLGGNLIFQVEIWRKFASEENIGGSHRLSPGGRGRGEVHRLTVKHVSLPLLFTRAALRASKCCGVDMCQVDTSHI
jgi:hypothetical protein